MGMFDNISTSESLPYSEEMRELGLDKNNLTYQTKDLDCLMDVYVIQNKKLYIQKYRHEKWIEGDKDSKSLFNQIGYVERTEPYHEEVFHHGEIYFYEFVNSVMDKWDCWIEYKAVFTQGILTGIELHKFEKTDNAARLQSEKEWKEKWEKEANKFINKYFLDTRLVQKIRRGISRCLNKLGNFITTLSLKV